MSVDIVLGTLYGDEGKGQCVHALTSPDSLVIRFSGGHQCGHTVFGGNGAHHVFSQFGSGSLKNAPTYISEYCTVYPKGFYNEFKVLSNKVNLKNIPYYVNPFAMVTTVYDVAYNKAIESLYNNHGSCGVGFGATIDRHEKHRTLYVQDLVNTAIFNQKMNMIKTYYQSITSQRNGLNEGYDAFLEHELANGESIDFYRDFYLNNVLLENPIKRHQHLIFEGSQGILLDQFIGVFPHVTRSNTTCKNALEILGRYSLASGTIWYVSRCYMTRHGSGCFPNNPISLDNNRAETNQYNEWQKDFKTAQLDLDLLEQSIKYNTSIVANYNGNFETQLILTCYDHLSDDNDKKKINDFISRRHNVQLMNRSDWELVTVSALQEK